MPFIEQLIEHTKIYESPTSFWLWSAITSIAAVVRDNVYIAEGRYKIWPNLYVFLYASSGARKDRPVRISEELVSQVGNTKVISGRSSIQAMMEDLAKSETSSISGKIIKGGAAIWYAPELAAGIVSDDTAIDILTDIYDGKTQFKSRLKSSPNFKIERLVFSSFLASNEAMARNFITARAIYGGYLARSLVVVPSEFRDSKSLFMTEELLDKIDREFKEITFMLKEIACRVGSIHFNVAAQKEYEKWYAPFRATYLKRGDKSGIAGRLHTHIKKIALILALNYSCEEITLHNVEQAIDLCIQLIPNYNNFVMSTGKSEIAEACSLIVKELFLAGKNNGDKMQRRELLQKHWQDLDATTIDKVQQTLEAAEVIETISREGKMYLKLKDNIVKEMGGVV